jgi:hypothetical protein
MSFKTTIRGTSTARKRRVKNVMLRAIVRAMADDATITLRTPWI